jgi:hypothetical protein
LAFDVEVYEPVVLNDRDADLFGRARVDNHLIGHWALLPGWVGKARSSEC